uniref:Cnidarian restricted protein n=1 Tax=Clytia hemisphaerica TaxID=252671 RepID=A0A7M5XFI3_9CNID
MKSYHTILLTVLCIFVNHGVSAYEEIPEETRQFCREQAIEHCVDNEEPAPVGIESFGGESKTHSGIQEPIEKTGKLEPETDSNVKTTTSEPLLYEKIAKLGNEIDRFAKITTTSEPSMNQKQNVYQISKVSESLSAKGYHKLERLRRDVSKDKISRISRLGRNRRAVSPPNSNVTSCWIQTTQSCIDGLRRRDGESCPYADFPMEDEICMENIGCYWIQYIIQMLVCD